MKYYYFLEKFSKFGFEIVSKRNEFSAVLMEYGYDPAFEMARERVLDFFSRINPKTGLIAREHYSPKFTCKKCQSISEIGTVVRFLEWFPNDEDVVEKCEEWAQATWKYFLSKDGGLYYAVDSETGVPICLWTYTSYYGSFSLALAKLYQVTGSKEYKEKCDYLVDFVWEARFRETDIPPSTLSCTGDFTGLWNLTFKYPRTDSPMVDTDCLYWVNKVFKLYFMLNDRKYKEIALAAANSWIKYSWKEQWKHFVVCVNGDGSEGKGPFFERIYGDGKTNCMELVTNAYKATRNERYLKYFDDFWSCMKRNSINDLFPGILERGKIPSPLVGPGVDWYVETGGIDVEQSGFLDIIVKLYEVTKARRYLEEADRYASILITKGVNKLGYHKRFWRGLGSVFLKYALVTGKVKREELEVNKPNSVIKVFKDGKVVLCDQVGCGKVILYLGGGNYQVTLNDKVIELN